MSNIPHSLKALLMLQSESRLKRYEPVKICARSDTKYTSVDMRQRIAEKKKRMKDVSDCGFRADPKELYRPLG